MIVSAISCIALILMKNSPTIHTLSAKGKPDCNTHKLMYCTVVEVSVQTYKMTFYSL